MQENNTILRAELGGNHIVWPAPTSYTIYIVPETTQLMPRGHPSLHEKIPEG
jgi:hypothetical protein